MGGAGPLKDELNKKKTWGMSILNRGFFHVVKRIVQ